MAEKGVYMLINPTICHFAPIKKKKEILLEVLAYIWKS